MYTDMETNDYLSIVDIRIWFLSSWYSPYDFFLRAVVQWKGLVETEMGALSGILTWLWNKSKQHFWLETLPFLCFGILTDNPSAPEFLQFKGYGNDATAAQKF